MSVQQIFLQHPTFIFHSQHLIHSRAAEQNAWKAKEQKRPLATSKQANSGKEMKRSFMVMITTTAVAWTLI